MTPGFWKGKRVLVTGNTGFKGSWLSYWLARSGAEVFGLALAPAGSPNLFEEAELAAVQRVNVVDVRDLEATARVVAESRCEAVFHLAAQSLVRESYRRPVDTYSVNAMGTAHVLEALRSSDAVRVVVCVTTDKCYENREWVWPYRENDALGGRDPYSSSKACAEIVAAAYRQSFFAAGIPSIATARGGNVIGGGDWSADRIVPDLIRAFAGGTPGIVRNPEGLRPWQHVLDALNGYLTLAERMWEDPGAFAEAWNFGPQPSAERRVSVVAEKLKNAWGEGAQWKHRSEEGAPHEASLLTLDSSKARSRLGWRDVLSFDDAVERSAQWYVRYYRGERARPLMDADVEAFERMANS